MARSLLDKIFRRPEPAAVVISTADVGTGKLPQGFFRVRTASGRETLGYSDSSTGWQCFNVRRTVNVGGKMVTMPPETKIEDLPLIQLDARRPLPGTAMIGDQMVLDTTTLDTFDGEVGYEPPSWKEGVDYI